MLWVINRHRTACLLPKANHLVLQVEAEFDVHLPIGFIHQQQIRVHGEGPADDNTLLGTHRQLVRIASRKFCRPISLIMFSTRSSISFLGSFFSSSPKRRFSSTVFQGKKTRILKNQGKFRAADRTSCFVKKRRSPRHRVLPSRRSLLIALFFHNRFFLTRPSTFRAQDSRKNL